MTLYLSCPTCGEDAVRLSHDRGHPRLSPVHGTRLRWSAGTAWGRCGGCGASWKIGRFVGELSPGWAPIAVAGVG